MFAVRQVAGKGLGAVAAQPILRGQRILVDRALLTLSSAAGSGSILQQAHALSATGRKALLALSSNPSKSNALSWLESIWQSRSAPRHTAVNHTILNIFRNNNFQVGPDTQSLFAQVARFNHACVPNAQGNFNTVLDAFTIHATRDIAQDEEITISYLEEQLGLRQSRQEKLQGGYGFQCDCVACASTTYEAGEARRTEWQQKLAKFAETASSDPEDEYNMMLSLLKTYHDEGIRGREAASIHIATARKAIDLGKTVEGHKLALKGLKLETEAVGLDSPFYEETKKEVEELGVSLAHETPAAGL